MPKTVMTPAPLPATLDAQKSDFTAEGAPAPGKVTASTPATLPSVKRSHKAKRPAGVRKP